QLHVGRIAGGCLPPPSEANPIPWLLAVLSLAVGLPFFVLSTNAPLLQHWFTATAHRSAKDPYYLYAASNLGSMLALLSYPTVVEPNLSLSTQSGLWIAGYGLFLALVATCAVLVWRFSGRRARKWESGRVGEWESQSVGEWESQSVKDVENPTNFSHATLPRSHALTLPR